MAIMDVGHNQKFRWFNSGGLNKYESEGGGADITNPFRFFYFISYVRIY